MRHTDNRNQSRTHRSNAGGTVIISQPEPERIFKMNGCFPCLPQTLWRYEAGEHNSFGRLVSLVASMTTPSVVVVTSDTSGLCKASSVAEIFYVKSSKEKLMQVGFTGAYWWDLAEFEESYFESDSFVDQLALKVSEPENDENNKKNSHNVLILDGLPTSKISFLLDRYKGDSFLKAIVISRRQKDETNKGDERAAVVNFQRLTEPEYEVLLPKLFADQDSRSIAKTLSCGLPYLLFVMNSLSAKDLTTILDKLTKANKHRKDTEILRKIISHKKMKLLVCAILVYRPYVAMTANSLMMLRNLNVADSHQVAQEAGPLLRATLSNRFFGCKLLFDYAWTCFHPKTKMEWSIPLASLLGGKYAKLELFRTAKEQAIWSIKRFYQQHCTILKKNKKAVNESEFDDMQYPKRNVLKFLENAASHCGNFLTDNISWLEDIFQTSDGHVYAICCAHKGCLQLLEWFVQKQRFNSKNESEMLKSATYGAAIINRNSKTLEYLFEVLEKKASTSPLKELGDDLEEVYLNSAKLGNWAIVFSFLRRPSIVNISYAEKDRKEETVFYYAVYYHYLPACRELKEKCAIFGDDELFKNLFHMRFLSQQPSASANQNEMIDFLSLIQEFGGQEITWKLFEMLLNDELKEIAVAILQTGKITLSREQQLQALEADVSEVSKCVIEKEGLNVNSVDNQSKNSLLVEAVRKGREKVVKALIANSCNVESPEEGTGKSPLFLAVEFGYKEIVRLLLKRKANQLSESSDGVSVLEAAVSIELNRHPDIVQLLLSCRATCETSMQQNFRALAVADDDGMKMLIIEHIKLREMSEVKKRECFKEALAYALRSHNPNSSLQDIRIFKSLFDGFKALWPNHSTFLQELAQFALVLGAEAKNTKLVEYLVSNENASISDFYVSTQETVLTLLLKSPVSTTDEENIATLIGTGYLDEIIMLPNPSGRRPIEMAIEQKYVKVIPALVIRNKKGSYIIQKKDRKLALKTILIELPTIFETVVVELDDANIALALCCVVDQNDDTVLQPFVKKINPVTWRKVYERAKKKTKLNIVKYLLENVELVISLDIDIRKELYALIRDNSLDILKIGKKTLKRQIDTFDDKNRAAIVFATEQNRHEIVTELLSWNLNSAGITEALNVASAQNFGEIAFTIATYCQKDDSKFNIKELLRKAIATAGENGSTLVLERLFSSSSFRSLFSATDVIKAYVLAYHKRHPAIRLSNIENWTPARMALKTLEWGTPELSSCLLKSRIPFNQLIPTSGNTFLMEAVENCYPLPSIRFLLDNKCCDIDAKNNFGSTALHLAAKKRLFDYVELLLDNCASTTIKDNSDKTALYLAVDVDSIETVTRFHQKLPQDRETVNICVVDSFTKFSKSPIWVAFFEKQNFTLVKLLRQMGANVVRELFVDQIVKHHRMPNQTTTLCSAVNHECFLTHFVDDLGGDVNVTSEKTNETMLMAAVQRGDEDLVECLLLRGAKTTLETKTKDGKTAAVLATQANFLRVLELLLRAGADINAYEERPTRNQAVNVSEKWPLLMIAVDKGFTDIVKLLMKYHEKIDMTSKNASGETALMKALKNGKIEAVMAIMAKINSQTLACHNDGDGNDVLSLSVLSRNVELVNVVIGEYCRMKISSSNINKNGETPLQMAIKMDQTDVFQALSKHMGKEELSGQALGLLVTTIAEKKDVKIVEALLETMSNGDILKQTDQHGNNVLAVAVSLDNVDAVQAVIINCKSRGLTVEVATKKLKNDETPFLLALQRPSYTVLKTFLENCGDVVAISLANTKSTTNGRYNGASVLTAAAIDGIYEKFRLLLSYEAKIEETELLAENASGNLNLIVKMLIKFHELEMSRAGNDAKQHFILQLKTVLGVIRKTKNAGVLIIIARSSVCSLIDTEELNSAIDAALCTEKVEDRETLIRLLNVTGSTVRRAFMEYLKKTTNAELLKLLYENSFVFCPKSSNLNDETIIARAIREGYGATFLAFIIDNKIALLTEKNGSGETALHFAVKENHPDIVQMLLEKGASPAETDNYGRTPLYLAVEIGHVKALEQFHGHLTANLDVVNQAARNVSLDSPLWVAFHQIKSLNISKLLVRMGAIIDDAFVRALLSSAQRSKDSIKRILEQFLDDLDIDINRVYSPSGDTLLMAALRLTLPNLIDMVQFLLARPKINLRIANNEGQTALALAIEKIQNELVTEIMKKLSADDLSSHTDSRGNNPLALAVGTSNFELVKVVLQQFKEKGVTINVEDKEGLTPLAKAVKTKPISILKAVLEASNNTDILGPADGNENNVLAIAVKESSIEAVDAVLFECSNRRNILENVATRQNKDGVSAFLLAVLCPVDTFLNKIFVECNNCDKINASESLAKILSNSRSSATGRYKGASALYLAAAENNNANVIDLLLSHGASVDEEQFQEHPNLLSRVVEILIKKGKETTQLISAVRIVGKTSNASLLNRILESPGRSLIPSAELHSVIDLNFHNCRMEDMRATISLLNRITDVRQSYLDHLLLNGESKLLNLLKQNSFVLSSLSSQSMFILDVIKTYPRASVAFIINNKLYSGKLNIKNSLGETCLHLVAKANWFEVVELLLKEGVSPAETDNQGRTPLFAAVENGHVESVQQFRGFLGTKYSEVVNKPAEKNSEKTPLWVAFFDLRNIEISRLLIVMGARIDDNFVEELFNYKYSINTQRNTSNKRKHVLDEFATELDVDVNRKSCQTGDTLLMTAIRKSSVERKEIIDVLLAVPTLILSANNTAGQTALTIAIQLKRTYAVKAILAKMSKEEILKEVDALGNNVIAKAVELRSAQQLVEVVLEQYRLKEIHFNNPNNNGETALSIAIATCQPEIVTAVIQRMSDEDLLKYRDDKGNNILAIAVLSNNIANVKAVLVCYSERNLAFIVPNTQSQTALTIAMATRQYEVVDLLLRQMSDAEIATPVDQQNNALASAVVLGDAKAVEVVVSVCDEKRLTNTAVLTPNRDSLSALFLAIECKNSDALAVIFKKSKTIVAKSLLVSRCNQKGKFNDASPLVVAAANGNYSATKFLYENGAEIDKQELLNRAQKHLVAKVVEMLVRYAKELQTDRQDLQNQHLAVRLTTIVKMAGEARSPSLLAKLLEAAEIQALLPNRDRYAALDSALTSEDIEERKGLVRVLNLMADRRTYATYVMKKGERKLLEILQEDGFDFFGTAKILLLHQAIAEDYHLEAIGFIIDRRLCGASLTDGNAAGETALHLAAKTNRADIVDLLLKKQASPTVKDKNGRTPLYSAVENGSLEALQKFKVCLGANLGIVNIAVTTKQPPLWLAFFEKRNLQISRLLIEMDALIDEGFVKELFNPKYKTEQFIEDYLSGLGISINRQSLETGNTLLMTAIENTSEKSAELIKTLINKPNVDLNIANNNSRTALMTAIHMNRADVVTLILAKTSIEEIIKQKDDEGNNILSIAVIYSSYTVVSVILEELSRRKVSINEPNKNGQTALYKALEKKLPEVVKAIMKKSDERDLVCSDINILSLAIQFRSLQCVQTVLSILEERGIAFNLPDKDGDTPLVKAFAIDDPLVPVILEKMRDEEIAEQVDEHGHNSLAKAVQLGSPKAVEAVLAECHKRALSEMAATKEDNDGVSPFFQVLQHERCDMLLKFLGNSKLAGCLVNSRSSSGGQLKGASALAVASKHYSVFCLLLEHGAVIDEQEIVNSQENFRQIVKMLIKFATDICQEKQPVNTKFPMEQNKKMKIAQSQLVSAVKIAGNHGDCFILGEILRTPAREMISTEDLQSAIDLAYEANNNEKGRRQLIEAINSTSEFRKMYTGRLLREGNRENLNSFLKAGLAFHSKQGEETVLVKAVNNKYPLASVALIIDNGQTCLSSISDRNIDDETVLHLAAKNNQSDIVDFLLQKSASPLDVDNCGRTALYVAVQKGHLEIVETMKTRLGKSMSNQVVNLPNKDGELPIWQAFFYQKNTKICRLLLDIGARIDESFVAQLFGSETAGIPGNNDARHAIERYLELGVDVNKTFGTSAETVLMIAARRMKGSETEVKKVLDVLLKQSDINLKAMNANNGTALDVAIISESPAAVASILKRLYVEDNTCLFDILTLPPAKKNESRFVLVAKSSLKILRVILNISREFGILKQIVEHKIQPNGDSPLIAAVENDNYQLAELLLEYEADVNADDSKALLNAVLTKKEKMAELLLSKGASIKSALHMAVASRDHEMVKTLLDSKECQPNADKVSGCQNELGDNVLAIAVRCRDSDMVKLLLDKSHDPSILNNFNCAGFTPLTIACVSLNMDIMQMLLDKGADANVRREKREDTVLLAVIRHFHLQFNFGSNSASKPTSIKWPPNDLATKVIKKLLEKGASPLETDKHGNTALMLACAKDPSSTQPLDMVKCLCRSFAKTEERSNYLNTGNEEKTTALMIAAKFGNLEIVEYLATVGAKVSVTDNKGRDALSLARANKKTDVVNYLKR